MLYPIFTYVDGTEVTVSKPDADGNIFLYVEKFDVSKDTFINATFVIPNIDVKSSFGYNKKELEEMTDEFSKIQYDIIEYVMDKVKGRNSCRSAGISGRNT